MDEKALAAALLEILDALERTSLESNLYVNVRDALSRHELTRGRLECVRRGND